MTKKDFGASLGKTASGKPAPAPAPVAKGMAKAMPKLAPVEVVKERTLAKRDTFSMPSGDYGLIEELRVRAAREGRNTSKSEVVRAGLQSLMALGPAQLVVILNALEKVKPGRK